MIIRGDCIEEMKKMPDNSVDAIITDPPYELGFMGKKWDASGVAYNVDLWKEALRVLKAGGHLIAFGGTRTYHRMACAIEDAGFEVRDMLNWCYASGFPKSLNVGVAYNKLEKEEWFKIGNAIDNFINKGVLLNVWKENLNNVKSAEKQSQKKSTEIGICIQEKDFVQESAVENPNQEKSNLNANIAERYFTDIQVINIKGNTAPKNVDTIITEIKELQDPAKFVERLSQKDLVMLWNIFTAQCDVKEWLKENTMVNLKVEEVLKTLRGNKKYSSEEIINVFYVVLTEILKLTILNQSKTFQNLDTIQQMECASAINVIIMEYMAENLISNTVDILKRKAVDKLQGNEREVVGKMSDLNPRYKTPRGGAEGYGNIISSQTDPDRTKGNSKWEGFGTALKPAHEPIIMARKPLSEKTIVENVLKHGTGAIDIDGCRIPITSEQDKEGMKVGYKYENGVQHNAYGKTKFPEGYDFNNNLPQGRFPANIICTDDALNDGVMTKSQGHRVNVNYKNPNKANVDFGGGIKNDFNDSGSKSRYFDIDVWAEKHGLLQFPKASKRERNEGCEGLEEKEGTNPNNQRCTICGYVRVQNQEGRNSCKCENPDFVSSFSKTKNHHPTVKPVHLMAWLVRLVSKEGDVVLDPFTGSGTTGVACMKLNRKFIGIEKEEEYCKIAEARIKPYLTQEKLR